MPEGDDGRRINELAWRLKFGGRDFACPHCGCEEFYECRARAWRQCRQCRVRIGVRDGMPWALSRLPLEVWFRAAALMGARTGISIRDLQRTLGLSSYGSAWRVYHRLREALRDKALRAPLRSMLNRS
jgi:hypothetical protein